MFGYGQTSVQLTERIDWESLITSTETFLQSTEKGAFARVQARSYLDQSSVSVSVLSVQELIASNLKASTIHWRLKHPKTVRIARCNYRAGTVITVNRASSLYLSPFQFPVVSHNDVFRRLRRLNDGSLFAFAFAAARAEHRFEKCKTTSNSAC